MRRIPLFALAAALVLSSVPAVLVQNASSAPGVLSATIYRDDFGVPHIYADDAYALWYANGYVQGQDRLWALDLVRHLGYGEGASVVGASVLSMDVSTRRDLYHRGELQQMLDAATLANPDLVAAVEGFTAGVNRAAVELAATGDMPAEFPALQHAFEPWTPLDTIAVATFLLARFGNGGGDELSNARLLAQLEATTSDPEAAFNDVVWSDTTGSYPTMTDGVYGNAGLLSQPKAFAAIHANQQAAIDAAKASVPFGASVSPGSAIVLSGAFPRIDPESFRIKWGSNALLVDGAISATGKAMVGGGPQTGYFNPQILYEVGLHGAGYDVSGVGVIGAPGVVLGRTATFAWTVTSGISDQTDVVALPAANDRAYFWDGQWTDLDCRIEVHKVRTPAALGGPTVSNHEQEVCLSVVGPIIGVTNGPDGRPDWFFASHTVSRMREADSAAKWIRLGAATDLDGFRAAFDGFAFTFNFHYAGADGNGGDVACYHHVGVQPLRHPDLDPRFPTPAGTTWQWTGELTGAAMPRGCGPSTGYYANWNNLPQAGWSAGDSRELWGSLHRVERLDKETQERLAASGGVLSLADVKDILKNAATEDTLAFQIVPAVLANTPPGFAPGATAALSDWAAVDYAWRAGGSVSNPLGTTYDDRGHTVYDRLLPALLNATLGDEQGAFQRAVQFNPARAGDPHAGDHGEHNNMFAVLVDALTGATAHDWCDDVGTVAVETCQDMVVAAYEATGLDAATASTDIPKSRQHFSRFTALGIGPAYTMPMTNRATYYHFHIGADTSQSGSAIAPGQSGQADALEALQILGGMPAPVHMRDQLPLYVGFGLKPVPVTEAQADAVSSSAAQTLLVPTT